jgi:hypothetical protein
MGAIGGVDELRRDADAASRAPDASLEHHGDAERVGDPANVVCLTAKRKRRRAGDHFQSRHVREEVDDLFGEAVAEVIIVSVGGQIRERENGNRRAQGRDSS